MERSAVQSGGGSSSRRRSKRRRSKRRRSKRRRSSNAKSAFEAVVTKKKRKDYELTHIDSA
jgi:hypothetical protein